MSTSNIAPLPITPSSLMLPSLGSWGRLDLESLMGVHRGYSPMQRNKRYSQTDTRNQDTRLFETQDRNSNPPPLKTFEGIFPAGPHGRPIYSAPITYRMKFPPRGPHHGIDCEIIFLALDNVNDIRKLLSLELTGAFVNEAREVVAPVIDALIGRIGRYPSMAHGGCVSPQVIADTNAPDEDSWWYDRFENNSMPQKFVLPDGREIDLTNRLFKQPPCCIGIERDIR